MAKNSFPIQIFPSILSGDFGRLADEAKRLEQAGADGIHIDIMDGHFVPNLTLGPKAVAAINKATPIFLDVHIMIYNPFDYIEAFVEAGADRITFHFEATEDVEDTLAFIRRCGKKAGLAFRPETSFAMVPKYLDQCDMILLMTVSPGFGGQKFMPEVIEKIEADPRILRPECHSTGWNCLQARAPSGIAAPFRYPSGWRDQSRDGQECVKAGANVLVSGNYLFGQSRFSDWN